MKIIPLARVALVDVLTWTHSHDGSTCKSGYRFLKEEANVLLSAASKSEYKAMERHMVFLGAK